MSSVRLSPAQLARFKQSQQSSQTLPHWVLRLKQIKPASLALLVQLAAALLIAMILVADQALTLNLVTNSALPLALSIALLQSSIALILVRIVLAKYVSVQVWWQWIHALFPIAIWGTLQLQISEHIYLAGFLVTLALYWSVHRTQVPFYPSFPATWRAVLNLMARQALMQKQASDKASLRVIDIGSGLGDLPMYLAKHRPQDQVLGIEIAPLPYLISRCRAWLTRSKAEMLLGDYHQHSFFQFDMVFAYLSPAAMPALWQKAKQEMRQGSVLVSSEFPVPDVRPTEIIQPSASSPALYLYRI